MEDLNSYPVPEADEDDTLDAKLERDYETYGVDYL